MGCIATSPLQDASHIYELFSFIMTVILLLNAHTGAYGFIFWLMLLLKDLPNSFGVYLNIFECSFVICMSVFDNTKNAAFVRFVFRRAVCGGGNAMVMDDD